MYQREGEKERFGYLKKKRYLKKESNQFFFIKSLNFYACIREREGEKERGLDIFRKFRRNRRKFSRPVLDKAKLRSRVNCSCPKNNERKTRD